MSSTEGGPGRPGPRPAGPFVTSRPFWRVHRVSRQLLLGCARGGARWTPGARRGVQERVPRAGARPTAAGSARRRTFPIVGAKCSAEPSQEAGDPSLPGWTGATCKVQSLRRGAGLSFPPGAQVRLRATPSLYSARGGLCSRRSEAVDSPEGSSCPTQGRPPEGRGKERSRHAGRDRRGRRGLETGTRPGAAPGRGPR